MLNFVNVMYQWFGQCRQQSFVQGCITCRRAEQWSGQISTPHNLALSVPWSHFVRLYSRDRQGCSTLHPCSFFLLRFWLSARYYSTGEEVFINHRLHLRLLSALWKDMAHIIVRCVPLYLCRYHSLMGRVA